MDLATFYEVVGYSASVFVAISLTMKNVRTLRIINLVGALLFTIYGALIGAYPVAALNGFIVIANIYYLNQMAQHDANSSAPALAS